ncbi:MAG: PilZ domain-containing protein [Chitinispirillaceae bacterium]|nr:PilZ domain-containing protein [Chitinispirillaceae bacterium]
MAESTEAVESVPIPMEPAFDAIREHRHLFRTHLNGTVTVSFYNRGKLYYCRLVNISAEGTRIEFKWEYGTDAPILNVGRIIECYLVTNRGNSKFRGMVRWVRSNGNRLYWGIQFTELSNDPVDPLMVLIEHTVIDGNALPEDGIGED